MNVTSHNIFLSFFILALSVVACQAVPDCDQESSYTLFKIKLYDKDSLWIERVEYDSIKAVGSDSLFFTSADSLSTYSLEVNSSKESSTFLFYSSLNVDSVSIAYDREVKIPFAECGPSFIVSNISITKSTFDSTILTNNLLNINIAENIEVYQ